MREGERKESTSETALNPQRTKIKRQAWGPNRGVQDLTLALLYDMCVCVFTVSMLVYSSNTCYYAEPLCVGDIFQSHPRHNPAAFSLHKFQSQSPKTSHSHTSCHIEIKAKLKPRHCTMSHKAPTSRNPGSGFQHKTAAPMTTRVICMGNMQVKKDGFSSFYCKKWVKQFKAWCWRRLSWANVMKAGQVHSVWDSAPGL